MLTQLRLKEVLEYDPEGGLFRWVKTMGSRAQAGQIAGCVNAQGYNVIRIDGRLYRVGRLAWFYMTGEWPTEIDHKDTNSQNDKWINLRDCNSQQNKQNRGTRYDSGTGVKGVYQLPSGRFAAVIKHDYSSIYLGSFNTIGGAEQAYNDAANTIQKEFAYIGERQEETRQLD